MDRRWILFVAVAVLAAVLLVRREEPLAEHPYPQQSGESPFVVAGIRAGMQYSVLDPRSIAPDDAPVRSRTMIGVFREKRGTRMLSPLGLLVPLDVLVDSIEDRVLDVQFGPLTEDAGFARQMDEAAAEWDAVTGGVRDTNPEGGLPEGRRSVTWRSADTVWAASIYYNSRGRAVGFRMMETTGYERTYRRHMSLWAKERGQEP